MSDKNQPLVPENLERIELIIGYFGAAFNVLFLVVIVAIQWKFRFTYLPTATKAIKHPKPKTISLVPYFWTALVFSMVAAGATWRQKRMILGVSLTVIGLIIFVVSQPIALGYVIMGIYLMLRASRRTRQQTAAGGGVGTGRAAASKRSATSARSSNAKPGSAGPETSKRYTPPKPKRRVPGESPTVGKGRGGTVRGELSSKKPADTNESPARGLLGRIRKEPED